MTDSRNIPRRTFIAGSAAAAAGLAFAPSASAAPVKKDRFFLPATWQPINGRSTVPMTPRRVVIHIADSDAPDFYGSDKGPGGSYAHFYNPRSGDPLQHQFMDREAPAQLGGNTDSISVEHQGLAVRGDSLTPNQINNLAKIFAWAHVFCFVPNRIATVKPKAAGGLKVNLNGLAWHRLGVAPSVPGGFGAYNPDARTTWCRDQTEVVWAEKTKSCPTDNFINQIDQVFDRAQDFVKKYRPVPPN